MTDLLTDWVEGRGREAHAHKEMVAGGLDPAEAVEGADGEEEEEEDTTTAMVKFTLGEYKERDKKNTSCKRLIW